MMRWEGIYLFLLLCLLQVVEKLEASGRLRTAVSKDPSTPQLHIGSNVTLECVRKKNNSLFVTWYKDGVTLQGGSGGIYYKMTSVNVTDQGFYHCVATRANMKAKKKGTAKYAGTTINLLGFLTTYVQFTMKITSKKMSSSEVRGKLELQLQTYLEKKAKKKVTVIAKPFKELQKRYTRQVKLDQTNRRINDHVKNRNRGRPTRRFARVKLIVYEDYRENDATTTDVEKYFKQMWKNLRRGTWSNKLKGISVSARSIRIKTLGYCLPGVTGKRHLKGNFKLPITAVGNYANVSCPYGPRHAHASIKCVESASGARWRFLNDNVCNYKSMMTRAFRRLARERISKRNARRLARAAKNLAKHAPPKEINEADVEFMQSIIKGIVNVGELDANGQDMVDIIDTVLNANESVLEESQKLNDTAKRYIELIDTIAANLSAPDNGTARQLLASNLVIRAQSVDASKFPGYRLSVASSEANKMITKNKISMEKLPEETIETGLIIPKEIFQNAGENAKGRLKIAVTIYQNAKFFQTMSANAEVDDANAEVDADQINVDDKDTFQEFKDIDDNYEETEENKISQEWSVTSRVISSSIVGIPIRNLTEPVELIFDPLIPKGKSPVCVFWDFDANGGHGNWSAEGCKYVAKSSGRITCHCDHMTNFAVLFTAHGPQSQTQDESHALALSIISYIGCAISLLGVLLTVITYAMFRSLRKSHAQHILISFCVSLALLLIVFILGATRVGGMTGCRVVAALLHYFVLTVVLWMGVEGYQMYLAFVKVLGTYQNNFMLKISVVAWGVPAIIVAITAASATSSYGNEQYCVLNGVAFYAAMLAPSVIILAVNFVIFVFVLWRLSHSHDAASVNKSGTIGHRCRTGLAIMVLLGLTWVFGAFAIRDAKLVFEYLFCIFNSLQGFFIFIFYCVRRPEVRKMWLGLFGRNELEYTDSTKSTGTKSRSIRTNSHSAQMV